MGPAHLGIGDSCAPICGDGLVVPGLEPCDDGNNQRKDGCTPDCQVEDLWVCFNDVPVPGMPLNGTRCIDSTPPILVNAAFDATFARIILDFDRPVTDSARACTYYSVRT